MLSCSPRVNSLGINFLAVVEQVVFSGLLKSFLLNSWDYCDAEFLE